MDSDEHEHEHEHEHEQEYEHEHEQEYEHEHEQGRQRGWRSVLGGSGFEAAAVGWWLEGLFRTCSAPVRCLFRIRPLSC